MSDKVRTAYIAGPITGDPDYKGKFAAAEADLIKKGFGVLNPAKIMESFMNAGVECRVILAFCTVLARYVDVLVMLEGWEKSEGAIKELAAYLQTGDEPKEVRYYALHRAYESIEAGWRADSSWMRSLSDIIADKDEDEDEEDEDEDEEDDNSDENESSGETETLF